MSKRIQIRRDSTYNWENLNPILADGEPGLEYETNKLKIGDGETNWSQLPYATGAPSLATVASTGQYSDLSGTPYIPTSFMDFVNSYGPANNRQFLRFDSSNSSIGFSSDFRVVPASGVVYPGGTIGVDKVGDVAFSQGTIYYCYQDSNSYSVAYAGSTNWVPAGWLRINSIGPNNTIPQVGNKITDGVTTSTITSIEANWGVQYADVSFMLINISPAVSSWKNGSGNLTVYTGTVPNLNCWAKIGTEIVSAPAHNNSNGIAGQIAFDNSYIYRCTQTNVSEISATYRTPKYTDSGYINQGSYTDIRINNNGVLATPQNGWVISDGANTRTITSVTATSGQSGNIWILGYTGDQDWGSVTSLTLISQQATDAVWKRTALNADTW